MTPPRADTGCDGGNEGTRLTVSTNHGARSGGARGGGARGGVNRPHSSSHHGAPAPPGGGGERGVSGGGEGGGWGDRGGEGTSREGGKDGDGGGGGGSGEGGGEGEGEGEGGGGRVPNAATSAATRLARSSAVDSPSTVGAASSACGGGGGGGAARGERANVRRTRERFAGLAPRGPTPTFISGRVSVGSAGAGAAGERTLVAPRRGRGVGAMSGSRASSGGVARVARVARLGSVRDSSRTSPSPLETRASAGSPALAGVRPGSRRRREGGARARTWQRRRGDGAASAPRGAAWLGSRARLHDAGRGDEEGRVLGEPRGVARDGVRESNRVARDDSCTAGRPTRRVGARAALVAVSRLVARRAVRQPRLRASFSTSPERGVRRFSLRRTHRTDTPWSSSLANISPPSRFSPRAAPLGVPSRPAARTGPPPQRW